MSVIKELSNAVIEGDSEKSMALAREIINQKHDINDAIVNGLNTGMRQVSELYAKGEYFLPEIIIAADALYDALDIFKPYLKTQDLKGKGTVVIGVVRGDIHDIGKNLTKTFLEASGYKVIDCGRNVKPEDFIDAVKKNNADIVALSTLMNPTLESISDLVNILKHENLFKKLKIIIGGAATSQQFAESLGVIYCDEATKASEMLDQLLTEGNK